MSSQPKHFSGMTVISTTQVAHTAQHIRHIRHIRHPLKGGKGFVAWMGMHGRHLTEGNSQELSPSYMSSHFGRCDLTSNVRKQRRFKERRSKLMGYVVEVWSIAGDSNADLEWQPKRDKTRLKSIRWKERPGNLFDWTLSQTMAQLCIYYVIYIYIILYVYIYISTGCLPLASSHLYLPAVSELITGPLWFGVVAFTAGKRECVWGGSAEVPEGSECCNRGLIARLWSTLLDI